LNFFDFAWSTALQITKKSYNELKILLHYDLRYPYLGKDGSGHVLHLIAPRKLGGNIASFQGLKFNSQNPFHKKIIWYMFKASVYHLGLHSCLSNFAEYANWARGKHLNLSTFVVSLVEDATVKKHLKSSFSWLLPELAYANTISFLRMKGVEKLSNDSWRVMSSLLLNYNFGRIKGKLKDEMLTEVEAVTSILKKVEENPVGEEKVNAATKIYDTLMLYGDVFEVPSLLYAESHGRNDLFYKQQIPNEEEVKQSLPEALCAFGLEIKSEQQLQDILRNLKESEINQVITEWQAHENSKAKILEAYFNIGKDTKFEDIAFPEEDYAEYQRRKTVLGSPIRRIMSQLRLLKNIGGEDFRQEAGFIDLQEAIQVIASKSQRTDIFQREELQTREDAWSILIDASHSLNMFRGEVRGIALCLAEVAKMLILNQDSWGIYAFNDKFYIIKDFSEKCDSHVKARIGGLKHSGFTYLPDAVLLAAQALPKRMEEAKILVVVSDFFPAGYEGGEEKLKENLKKVKKMGIGLLGIGVNSTAVKQYVQPSCVVEGPYDLMKKFSKAFVEYSSS
jgi:hypothetical protein